ncbi:MAG: translocation/assembly module TamB, partial [Muribaculaceae bacterium]|nr:translocation/assembly module TamB [Muribaculaceae bacterium]
DIRKFRPGVITPLRKKLDFDLSAELDASLQGNSIDNLIGQLSLQRLIFNDLSTKRTLSLDSFDFVSRSDNEGNREYQIISEWLEGDIKGHFQPSRVPLVIHGLLAETFPDFVRYHAGSVGQAADDQRLSFDFTIERGGNWSEFFHLPVTLLSDATLSGALDGVEKKLTINFNAPYIRQGRDKLIRNLDISGYLHEGNADCTFNVIYPTKKGDLELLSAIKAKKGDLFCGIDFNPGRSSGFFGHLDLEAKVSHSVAPLGKEYSLHVLPGILYLNNAAWNVADSKIKYCITHSGNFAEINGFGINHGSQFVSIDGKASVDPDDSIIARLNDIDLNYIFDTLNINYVHFGGMATGEAVGSALFTPHPVVETRNLFVSDLSYNNGILGDAQLHGDFDFGKKRVGIHADIAEKGRRVALVDGGVWIGRDSLSFDFDADKVNIDFLYPFMQAFASRVEGRASGKAKLYGTFSDIDMTGRLFADTISVGVAYTNVSYSGRDSVIIDPGRINIPSFTLSDQFGNTAVLEGELTHRYFHEPQFDFKISNASNLLVYDTNSSMNPIWYGRIFGSGNGRILGIDNYVGITADMTTQANSNFTFVLSDREEATEYNFIKFTDRKKQLRMATTEVELTDEDLILQRFRKQLNIDHDGPESVFGMDIRATITPATTLTIIMDPVAGDKITAHGSGAMNMTYQSDTDDLRMFGKYVLDEGVYNFSLQDLILKDFIIKNGSSISFNGDPMAGLLDIRAAYRVNANLADLDQSFALDRDLNRTNVPVDAMLLVNGEMSQPDISFDIELPTLNDEVEQKVRSVISSEDMMNLQMIYLLGLNRFYTPEYMGRTSGGEWASVASSTISSQLQNIMGQLTDKVSVLPSFKSDKGDFSDIEVDVALSSRLFSNRLLINGNFGYRDPSTSSTTFIGDFDIEYLLNRQGNWRLKAYNHFNDQNYYLKSALTTQGVGIVWRRDFDHIFGINKRKKDKKDAGDPRWSGNKEVLDSIDSNNPAVTDM